MSSTSSVPNKAPSAPATPNYTPSAPPTSNTNFDTARRPSQTSPQPQSAPRKTQASRKQHRNQRRAPGTMGHIDEEDAMAEIRALRNASSRRGQTSITHLMSYALPPRPTETHASYARTYRRNPSWGVGSGYHAADKARYIHANYRFVVRPGGSYAAQAADADVHIEWADVWQVIASAESQQASCPICLSEPVAPRMAKCGHIFCLPCLMRFMNTSSASEEQQPGKKQTRWRKCPICDDSVYLADVRPVRFYAGQECPLPRKGDDVILRLMMRTAKNTLALPKEGALEVLQSGEDIPWHFAANVLDYARIMRGTVGYMEEQFEREVEDLVKQETEDELLYQEVTEWTQRAVKTINTAKEKLSDLSTTESSPPNNLDPHPHPNPQTNLNPHPSHPPQNSHPSQTFTSTPPRPTSTSPPSTFASSKPTTARSPPFRPPSSRASNTSPLVTSLTNPSAVAQNISGIYPGGA